MGHRRHRCRLPHLADEGGDRAQRHLPGGDWWLLVQLARQRMVRSARPGAEPRAGLMADLTDQQLIGLGARRINTDTDPDELVLPESSAQRLRRIAEWLVQPPPVLKEWGLNRYIDGGLRALFRGPSGTGKTMAAAALGRWTERPVLHVDLGAVCSKYIGETAKKLRDIFDAAAEGGAILYFDEADTLFGKHSEVEDSHDRYANAEIGYLLRRLEPYEGLAIIATNGRDQLDEAALSRLDGTVEFPIPDEPAREQLWRRLLASVKMLQS